MNNPEHVRIEPEQVTAEQVTEQCYLVANDEKIPLLIGLLRSLEDARSIVFVNTKRAADVVWGYLTGNGFPAAILSGDVPQKKRMSLLHQFAEGDLSILVATDVAARGLHIPAVSHVFNYDLPEDAEDYVHRIGRTARAGATGDAISFACETYSFSLPAIEEYIGHPVPMSAPPSELLVTVDPASRVRPKRDERRPHGHGRDGHGGGGGRRRPPRRRGPGGPSRSGGSQ
jgi:ATP-dependent RNA helicase RhlB